jgi:hypothetical protein
VRTSVRYTKFGPPGQRSGPFSRPNRKTKPQPRQGRRLAALTGMWHIPVHALDKRLSLLESDTWNPAPSQASDFATVLDIRKRSTPPQRAVPHLCDTLPAPQRPARGDARWPELHTLFRRNDFFYWRRRLPLPLGGPGLARHLCRSLGTAEPAFARLRALRLTTAFEDVLSSHAKKLRSARPLIRWERDQVLGEFYDRILDECQTWASRRGPPTGLERWCPLPSR